MSSPTASAPIAPAVAPKPKLHVDWRAATMVIALAAIWVIFSWTTWNPETHFPIFLTAQNLSQLTRQIVVVSLLGIGMVLVIVAGQIDLSVGRLAGLLGGVAAMAYVNHGMPLAVAFGLALLLGAALGALQGALVAFLGIPSFIVTLGGMLVFEGVLLGVSGGQTVSPPDGSGYLYIGTQALSTAMGWLLCAVIVGALALQQGRDVIAKRIETPAILRRAAMALIAVVFTSVMNRYHGIPASVVLLLGLAAMLFVIAQHTPFGRHLYAIGGNREAAFYSGINIKAHVIGVFAVMGLMAAIGGITLSSWLGAATSDAGANMELDAIAAAVIGGTSLQGGLGSVWGALLGALVMASLDNGMSLMNTDAYWQFVIKGLILVAAVAADMAGRKGR